MIIERLSQEHRNIEKLLAILERELEVFDRGDVPTTRLFARLSAISKSTRNPEEDLVFAKLRTRDPVAAAKIGDLTREHTT